MSAFRPKADVADAVVDVRLQPEVETSVFGNTVFDERVARQKGSYAPNVIVFPRHCIR